MAKDRIKRERDDALTLAWSIAALQRQKELPKLETLLRPAITSAMRRGVVQEISTHFGLPVKRVRLIRREHIN